MDEQGASWARESTSTDPAGNVRLTGAAEALRGKLIELLGDGYFQRYRRGESAARSDLHQKSRPHPARRAADPVRPLLRGAARAARRSICWSKGATTPCRSSSTTADKGFHVEGYDAQPVPRPLGPDPRPPDAPGASTIRS